MTEFEVRWTERKKAIVTARNEEEAEQMAYDLPDSDVHQETIGLEIFKFRDKKKLKKVI